MSVDLTVKMEMTVAETITIGTPGASDALSLVTHNLMNISESLNDGTGVPVTKVALFDFALSSGTGTIDLRDLVGTNLGPVDMSGLKVQYVMFKNKLLNDPITIADGASGGYGLGGVDFKIELQPGQAFMFRGLDLEDDVSGSAYSWDLNGTLIEELEVEVVCG